MCSLAVQPPAPARLPVAFGRRGELPPEAGGSPFGNWKRGCAQRAAGARFLCSIVSIFDGLGHRT